MASQVPLQLPENFSFAHPDTWIRWIKRFERFRVASGLSDRDESVQVSTLIYAMGEEAEDILASFELNEADRSKYDNVKKSFEDHFVKRHNPIFERARFNQRMQQQGETVDSFVTALHSLAEHCDYGPLREQMIRDRLVVGLLDANLAEKLQLEPDLKLADAVARARNSETVKSQQSTVRGSPTLPVSTHAAVTVDAIHVRPRRGRTGQFHRRTTDASATRSVQQQSGSASSSRKCTWCGNAQHPRDRCPARKARCRKCKKMGHFAAVCRSINQRTGCVNTVVEEAFLGAIDSGSGWTKRLFVNGVPVRMKLDTGADVTVVPKIVYDRLLRSPTLAQSDRVLRGPDGTQLPVLGKFEASITDTPESVADSCCSVYVVRNLQQPLLGRPEIDALGLLTQVDVMSADCLDKAGALEAFPRLFSGLGEFKGPPHKIHLKESATPYSITVPRRVPFAMIDKVASELKRLEQFGVIRKVEDPTDWCAGMVIVPKANGSIRICCDFTRLNESVRRERHILPSVDHLLGSIQCAKVFTKLDANCGFHQIPLDTASQRLTTFITPFGRYCYRRLPFGISSAPEYFQKRMSQVLDGLKGVICMIDDVLVFGSTREEHDSRLLAVLQRIDQSGITLNAAKCEFRKASIRFCGYIIDNEGIHPDPCKTEALANMPACQNVAEVRRFLGMANQLGKFTPRLAQLSHPLRQLLSKGREWCWNDAQQKAFNSIKVELTSPAVLALYNPNFPTCVSADASSFGLGAVIAQKQHTGEWRPVAFQSRSLLPAEQRYSQIEKEALAITWACDRFSHYLLGVTFHIQTDHKPLVPIFSSKPLDQLPPRILRYRLRLMRFHFTISHVPGKDLTTADTLSRAPIPIDRTSDNALLAEVTAFIAMVTETLPATDQRLREIRVKQTQDEVCSAIRTYCKTGWPSINRLPSTLRQYWAHRGELNVNDDDLLLCGQRIVVPACLRAQVLEQLHVGHQGITKCRQRAKQSVWWPGLSTQLSEYVRSCAICAQNQTLHAEPLIPNKLPTLPWQKVAADFFDFKSKTYLLVVDYYSRFIELALLSTMRSSETIRHLRSIFARHGIPEQLVTDNGSQFTSQEFRQFTETYQILHTTSSPLFPQSNGMAERAVQTAKRLIRSSSDPYAALLAYRSTPLESGYSPAQLLFGRQLRSTVPVTVKQRRPKLPDIVKLIEHDAYLKQRQKQNFDSRHKSKVLPILPVGSTVFLPDRQESGEVISLPNHRSYVVSTPSGNFRRNRRHLNYLPRTPNPGIRAEDSANSDKPDQAQLVPNNPQPTTDQRPQPSAANTAQGEVVTRSGRISRPPLRLQYGGKEEARK